MADAQLKFRISNQSLIRLDSYVPTEGSENYIHASFEVDEDYNVPNAVLAVYARYDDKVYVVPRNIETGLYDIDLPYLQYPGFYIQCQLFNSEVTRNTEEVFIKVAGNGNILKRFLKAPDEYSIELLSKAYNQSTQNAIDIQKLSDKLDVIILALKELSNNAKSTYSTLGSTLDSLNEKPNDTPIEEPDSSESSNSDDTLDGLVSGDGVFIG